MIDNVHTLYLVLLTMLFVRSIAMFNLSLIFVRGNVDNIRILEQSYLKIYLNPFIWTKEQLKKSLQA